MESGLDRQVKKLKALLAQARRRRSDLAARGQALVKYIPAAVPAPVQIELQKLSARGRALVKRVPEPVQIELRKFTARSARVTREIFAGLLVIGLIAVVAGYGRLNSGPISLDFLVPTIESNINRELVDFRVEIDDAILQRAPEGRGVVFRLRNIRLIEADGQIVAQAPYAAVGLSGSALLSGRIATGSVDFIGPRLLVYYSEDTGLALSFSRPAAEDGQAAIRGTTGADGLPSDGSGLAPENVLTKPPADKTTPVDVTRTMAETFDRLRQGRASSSYLTRFGVKDATVIFDRDGTQTLWQVPDFAIDLEHSSNRSTLFGKAGMRSTEGDWQMQFELQQSARRQSLALDTRIENLVPAGIASNFPSYAGLLSALNIPLDARTKLEFSTDGEFLSGEANVKLAAGQIVAPWAPYHPMIVDGGNLRVRYRDKQIDVGPATLRWGNSRATVTGSFVPEQTETGTAYWQFKLEATDAVLETEEFGLPGIALDEWSAEGRLTSDAKQIVVDRFVMRSGDASIALRGQVRDGPGSPEVYLAGEISPMKLDTLKHFWPKVLAPDARDWVGERVHGGTVAGGRVELSIPAGQLAALEHGADLAPESVRFALALSGMSVTYVPGLPPLVTGESDLTVIGRSFELKVPEAAIILPSGEHLNLTAGSFSIPDLREDPPLGEIRFSAGGNTRAALELLDHEPLGYLRSIGLEAKHFGGTAQGEFSIGLPLISDLEFEDTQVGGSARLVDAIADNVIGDVDLEGGTIDVTVSPDAVQAQGAIVVKGVPATLGLEHFFAATDERQPPVRVSAVLDEAQRSKLGIEVNHLVRGPLPVSLLIKRNSDGVQQLNLEADLTNNELTLAALGWSKPAGRAALLQADVIHAEDGSVDLHNFQVGGDGITINGRVSLDPRHKLKSFHFPVFSFNQATRVELTAQVRDGKVLEVDVSGPSYDGKEFFQSLFSAGKVSERQLPDPPDALGVDVRARLGTVIGHFDTTLKDVELTAKKRNGVLTAFDATGKLGGDSAVGVRLDNHRGDRLIRAESRDAGSAFRLIGFYPSIEAGEASLEVNLDAGETGTKSGTLWARNFVVLGDPVVQDVLTDPRTTAALGPRGQQAQRARIVFDQLRAPFAVGQGQFILGDAYMNGPVLGATMRGRVDFRSRTVDLGGTYVPLYGLNAALGQIPLLGNLFVGREGEGVVGITFAIQGPLDEPAVLVNPMSMVAPGIFRQIFEFAGTGQGQGQGQPSFSGTGR
jgi:hypothetical protein